MVIKWLFDLTVAAEMASDDEEDVGMTEEQQGN
jgi:hypothetical protein